MTKPILDIIHSHLESLEEACKYLVTVWASWMVRESHWRGNLVAVKSEEDKRLPRWLSLAVAAVELATDSSDCP